MDAVVVYKCLCDASRLRILNLLSEGPLCVCHLQGILDETQVKTSKQLGYLRRNGLVETERHNNWTIYRLPSKPHPLVIENLKCLQDCRGEMKIFRADLRRRQSLLERLAEGAELCPPKVIAGGRDRAEKDSSDVCC
jgi:ArsR family transcriptional regulator